MWDILLTWIERYALALAARRRLKTAIGICVPLCVPFNLTEIMRTAVALKTTAQRTRFCGGSQELETKICIMQSQERAVSRS